MKLRSVFPVSSTGTAIKEVAALPSSLFSSYFDCRSYCAVAVALWPSRYACVECAFLLFFLFFLLISFSYVRVAVVAPCRRQVHVLQKT